MDSINIGKKDNKQKSYEIEGLFKPKMGADGKFTVVLRFLPSHPDEEIPWVEKVFYYDPRGKTFYPK